MGLGELLVRDALPYSDWFALTVNDAVIDVGRCILEIRLGMYSLMYS